MNKQITHFLLIKHVLITLQSICLLLHKGQIVKKLDCCRQILTFGHSVAIVKICSLAHTYSSMPSWQLLEQENQNFGEQPRHQGIAEGEVSKMQLLQLSDSQSDTIQSSP